jgi:DNA-binding transcriptional ArsR family regulator
MEHEIDARLVAAMGSETRVRVLAVLAGAFRPLTAYRIGKTGDIPLPKTYREIYRLEKAGIVARRSSGWVLLDDDLRAMLRKRIPIRWWEDWSSERSHRFAAQASLVKRLEKRGHPPPPRGWRPKDVRSFVRSPLKDRVLKEMGLRTSLHAK